MATILDNTAVLFLAFPCSFLLQELVPCVLLSFDDEQILMWRGQNWKSMYPEVPSVSIPAKVDDTNNSDDSGIFFV